MHKCQLVSVGKRGAITHLYPIRSLSLMPSIWPSHLLLPMNPSPAYTQPWWYAGIYWYMAGWSAIATHSIMALRGSYRCTLMVESVMEWWHMHEYPIQAAWWKIFKVQLTHWGWDKMAAIFQTTFSNAFFWMKMVEFWLKFHWSLFLRVKLTRFQHSFR